MYILNTTTWIETSLQTKYINARTSIETSLQIKFIFWTLQLE